MKKMRSVAAGLFIAIMLSVSLGGCYGNFVLYHKIYKWNGTQGDKWQRSVIHAAMWIIPVYGFSLFVDLVALNTVEFWTGTNPLAMNEGEKVEQVITMGDEKYRVIASRDRWDVEVLSGKQAGMKRSLVFADDAWYVEGENFSMRIITHDKTDPMKIILHMPDGTLDYQDLEDVEI